MENLSSEKKVLPKYIIFELGGQTYGTPILDVREVTEFKVPKPIPNSQKGFRGVINLRGEVVGVIDLRDFLEIEQKKSLSLLVFETDGGVLGAMVDRVLSVSEIPEKDIEREAAGSKKSGQDYYTGIAKTKSGLVTLIDLKLVSQHMTATN